MPQPKNRAVENSTARFCRILISQEKEFQILFFRSVQICPLSVLRSLLSRSSGSRLWMNPASRFNLPKISFSGRHIRLQTEPQRLQRRSRTGLAPVSLLAILPSSGRTELKTQSFSCFYYICVNFPCQWAPIFSDLNSGFSFRSRFSSCHSKVFLIVDYCSVSKAALLYPYSADGVFVCFLPIFLLG